MRALWLLTPRLSSQVFGQAAINSVYSVPAMCEGGIRILNIIPIKMLVNIWHIRKSIISSHLASSEKCQSWHKSEVVSVLWI